MSKTTKNENENNIYPAKVAKVIDEYQIVINKGKNHEIKKGDRFLIYRLDEEINDPDTGESLGVLELIIGKGEVIHVQDSMSTLKSTDKKNIKIRNTLGFFPERTDTEDVPFDGAETGDLAKPI